MKDWNIYLAGEIHSNWRDAIRSGVEAKSLPITVLGPEQDHDTSDRCGETVGVQTDKFWYDHQAAKLNSIRTRKYLASADVVVVKFGEKYRQWNAAFDAGIAAALGKPLIIIHGPELIHALKEIDAAAMATVSSEDQVVSILEHVTR